MRLMTIAALSIAALVGGVSAAASCEPVTLGCTASEVVWPLYTQNGRRLGAVDAREHRLPSLEVSRYTGQPLSVIYDHPGSRPGAIDPYMRLVPLPRTKRSDTVGAYPVGY